MKFDETRLKRTMAGLVRSDIARIELWVKRGVQLTDIYAQFVAQGAEGSYGAFKRAVHRARESNKASGQAALPSSASSGGASIQGKPATGAGGVAPAGAPPRSEDQKAASEPAQAQAIDIDKIFQRKSLFDK